MKKFIALAFGIICLVVVILACVDFGPKKTREQFLADNAAKAQDESRFQLVSGAALTLRKRMRDPDSFVVSSAIIMSDNSVCFSYRARNGFGGMDSGFAMDYAGIVLSNPGSSFDKIWKKECKDKPGYQMADDVMFALREYDKRHNY